MIPSLDKVHLDTKLPEVFCGFHANESSANDGCRFDIFLDRFFPDAKGILHRTEGVDFAAIDTGQAGLYWQGPGREKKLVVALLINALRGKVSDGDRFSIPVDGGDLMAHAGVNAKTLPESLGGLER